MRIISARVADGVLEVATVEGRWYRSTLFDESPSDLRGCHCASTLREFLGAWSSGVSPPLFSTMHHHPVLAFFPHENKAYLTSADASGATRGLLYQLLKPNELPGGIVLSEWAQLWMNFVKEAGARGDVDDDVVDGHRFLPHDVH